MNILIWVGIAAAVIWAVILVLNKLYDLESKGISVSPGMVTWRTKHGLGVLDRIAKAGKRFWKVFGLFGGGIGAILMAVMFALLVLNTVMLFTVGAPPGTGGAGVRFAIPGITIPLAAGIIGLATVLIVHEPAHGVILRKLGMKTKSTGLALFVLIPGAFVEEDEDEFEEASVSNRIQVAGAGPFANIIFAIICFLIILALVSPLSGLYITETAENSPAAMAGLPADSRLIGIDDTQIDGYSDLENFMEGASPGQEVVLETTEDRYPIVLGSDNGDPHIGIRFIAANSISRGTLLRPIGIYSVAISEILRNPIVNQYTYSTSVPWFLVEVLKWIFTLNLLVGLFNLLPLKPLDGGHIVEGLSEKITSKENANRIANGISSVTILIIILNFFPALMG
uniref:Membrane protein containing Peptidase M50 domain protein n=1 Tax=uncultured organism TaxID=155900 RepID=M1PQI2_9ZZZZ|nr:membrane protein containing Peptidase M50 domain protein [uncultured organism]